MTLRNMGEIDLIEAKQNKEKRKPCAYNRWCPVVFVTICLVKCVLIPITTQEKARLDRICGHGSNLGPINQANLKARHAVCIQLKWYCVEHTHP